MTSNIEILGSIIILMLITLIVLQVAQLTKKKTENDFNFLKELSDFKGDLHIILQSRFVDIVKENRDNDKNTRESVQSFLKTTEMGLSKSFESLSVGLSEKINNFNRTMGEKLETMTRDIDKMTQKVDIKLENIQKDNTNQLEKIRQTVDEKLQHTLEKRLGESFKIVSDRLEQVHKGLGEMQNLAIGVGDLKKVLSNVKTRGTLGEIQLGNILEQIFSPEQYAKNVKVKPESNEVVEFTIRLPGKELEQYVHIPIDSKFPLERYHMVIEAYEIGELESIKSTNKELENAIMKSAKDIREKYINVPYTTDFAIMFLPIEGLYAEVVRTPGLLEKLQSDKVMVAGPTTLVAMLNSLQMGFRTLAIEKRSSEVREVLGQVKTEFDKFGGVLAKAKKKIREASEEIDELVGARTNQIQRKLKNIQTDSGGLEYIKKSEDQTIPQKNKDLNLVI